MTQIAEIDSMNRVVASNLGVGTVTEGTTMLGLFEGFSKIIVSPTEPPLPPTGDTWIWIKKI